ncbi:MAG: hypothetical protein ACPGJS_13345 [Flammeovirgaceae bacterium]
MSILLLLLLGTSLIGLAGGLIWHYNKSYQQIAKKISDKEIIQIARDSGGRITAADLVENSSLTIGEANLKIQQLLNNGILRYKLTNSFKVVYELDSNIQHTDALPKRALKKRNAEFSSDGDIIAFAVKAKGKLSAAALCMKSGMSIEDAQQRLKFLQEKGVFDIEVSENGTIHYTLNDLNLLEE